MHRTPIAFLSFAVAFWIGSSVGAKSETGPIVEAPNVASAEPVTGQHAAQPVSIDDPLIEFQGVPTFEVVGEPNMYGNLIDVFQRKGIYRESEVIARTGEKWLVLTQTSERYTLVSTAATVRKKNSVSYPGDAEKDVELSFANIHRPIMAVRRIPGLQPGRVETLYHRPSDDEISRRNLPIDPMKTGYKREFNLGGRWYTLRVSRGKDTDGTTIGLLVLEHETVDQIVAQNYYDEWMGEIIGELRWVGDLDGDGRLDLYFDYFNEKGFFRSALYLSTAADPNKLVGLAAEFATAGC